MKGSQDIWITANALIENKGKILLVKRNGIPFEGKLAIPGGHLNVGETAEQAAVREVKEETGLDVKISKLLGVYSNPKRNPLRHTVCTTFVAEVIGGELKAGDDAKDVKWFDPKEIKEEDLAFDHYQIIQDLLEILQF